MGREEGVAPSSVGSMPLGQVDLRSRPRPIGCALSDVKDETDLGAVVGDAVRKAQVAPLPQVPPVTFFISSDCDAHYLVRKTPIPLPTSAEQKNLQSDRNLQSAKRWRGRQPCIELIGDVGNSDVVDHCLPEWVAVR